MIPGHVFKLLVCTTILFSIIMEAIIFSSLNVYGLRDVSKRTNVLSFIKRHRFDIIFLQETHLTNHNEGTNFFRDFPGKHFHSFGTNTSRGVSILLSNKFSVNEIKPSMMMKGVFYA